MNNTSKQRLLWIGGILLAAWYFGLPIINSYRQQEAYRRAIAARQEAAAKAAKQASPLPAPGASNPASNSLEALAGVWQGGAVLTQGMCGLKLELRKKPGDADHFAGYPVLGCMPIPGNPTGQAAGTEAQRMIASANPVSAVLTGTPQNGSIIFTVDKVIGETVAGCSMTGMTATPFGSDQIAVEWQESTCPGGHMLLKRVGK